MKLTSLQAYIHTPTGPSVRQPFWVPQPWDSSRSPVPPLTELITIPDPDHWVVSLELPRQASAVQLLMVRLLWA